MRISAPVSSAAPTGNAKGLARELNHTGGMVGHLYAALTVAHFVVSGFSGLRQVPEGGHYMDVKRSVSA